jgi:hypothetical protein
MLMPMDDEIKDLLLKPLNNVSCIKRTPQSAWDTRCSASQSTFPLWYNELRRKERRTYAAPTPVTSVPKHLK